MRRLRLFKLLRGAATEPDPDVLDDREQAKKILKARQLAADADAGRITSQQAADQLKDYLQNRRYRS